MMNDRIAAERGKVAAVVRVMAVVTVGVKKVGWAEEGGGSGGRRLGDHDARSAIKY
jgi:hypothetical protein